MMRSLAVWFLLLASLAMASSPDAIEIGNGETAILQIDELSAGELSINDKAIKWLNHPSKKGKKIVIVGTGYYAKDDILVRNKVGESEAVITLKLTPKKYKKEQISVDPNRAKPASKLPASIAARIKAERDEVAKIYATSGDKLLFSSAFENPINSAITSPYGTARVFNGELKSYHGGTDFRAASGTPIKAANDGVVRLAKERYYAGGSVIIDHGGGIYSQYYHLSELKIKEGDSVKKGAIIGLSGATGRVSGPHLHFGIMVGQKQVNPLDFIEKINAIF